MVLQQPDLQTTTKKVMKNREEEELVEEEEEVHDRPCSFKPSGWLDLVVLAALGLSASSTGGE